MTIQPTKKKGVWKITGPGKTVSTSTSTAAKKMLPHYKELPVTDDMPEGQRNFAIQYNTMRAKLIEHGLMKSK